MRVVLDTDKNAANIAKHHLPLSVAEIVIDNAVVTFLDTRLIMAKTDL